MKRTTVNHFMQLIEYQQNIFKGKYPVKGAVWIYKTLARMRKLADKETKLAEAKQEFEDFKKT